MDSPEYLKRLNTPFVPPTHTFAQLRAAVPKELFEKSTVRGLAHVFKVVACVALFAWGATHIDSFVDNSFSRLPHSLMCTALSNRPSFLLPGELSLTTLYPQLYEQLGYYTCAFSSLRGANFVVKWGLWCLYWWAQSIATAGMWCLAHEAGHGTISPYEWLNNTVGYLLHTPVLTPYFSWRATHHTHHKTAGSVERDENFVPYSRSDYNLPPRETAHASDYHDILEETPMYTMARILIMQLFGFHAYLAFNTQGSPLHPKGTNHFNPNSTLFKDSERFNIHISNLGLAGMVYILFQVFSPYGLGAFIKFYFIPYLFMNHWIVMLTFLHHTDPTLPHYRKGMWSYLWGASATVDRPLLGWMGRFFFVNVSHDHVAHHHFSMIPFYNQPRVTELIKPVLGHSYNYDSTNTFYALYRSFTQCQFIEEDEDIAFYKNKYGVALRELAKGKME